MVKGKVKGEKGKGRRQKGKGKSWLVDGGSWLVDFEGDTFGCAQDKFLGWGEIFLLLLAFLRGFPFDFSSTFGYFVA
jgi:hypothetical protein